MTQSNALSQQLDHIPPEDYNNEDITLLPKTLFIQIVDMGLRNLLLHHQNQDMTVLNALQAI